MNMIESAKAQVRQLTAAAGLLPAGITAEPAVEIPKDTANGDYTTTFCLAAAKAMKMNPRQVAQTLIDHTTLTDSYFTSVEIAGPGFMNFRLGGKWFADTVSGIETAGEKSQGSDDHGGVRLRQPHRPHAHGQRPGRRAGRHFGQRAAKVRCGRVA